MATVAQWMVALSQGLPFFHAGDELLRSKSLDRDSYDSGPALARTLTPTRALTTAHPPVPTHAAPATSLSSPSSVSNGTGVPRSARRRA